ncbi:MAG: class I SAM-dependent methyltransferase [Alphaproteobacteria bacterium]|nr:class I SAM-dependent methyltransferase [Alphaproteobacteria bacterium]MBV8334896.1 class I SAM-dependent methyltransferase [Alphaproteobacteria bacterium]
MRISNCRSCGSADLQIILDLGSHPIANALLSKDDLDRPEPKYPLMVAFCQACTLLQVTETVPPDVLYRRDYPYFSSSSPALLEHSAQHVDELVCKYRLDPNSFVIEVASNDGYLLHNFIERGIPCLGIDPADGPVARANAIGVRTIHDYFGSRCAEGLAREGKLADVVIANNVVAHVDDINDFVEGFARLLKPTGVAIFEFAYAADMIEQCEFDTIYHEHLFYHTLHGLTALFGRHGLCLNDVERLPIHGGSLRLTVSRTPARTDALEALFAHEAALGIDKLPFYNDFAARVRRLRDELAGLLVSERTKGRRIACYGAAAKGATLVNYLALGAGFFEFVADANPYKQDKFMPGQHIPIRHPDQLVTDQPDYALLLVWNFAGEVMRQQARYRQRGGSFIIPIPEPRIVPPGAALNDTNFAITPARSDGPSRPYSLQAGKA